MVAAHNLKAAGSNPAPATKKSNTIKDLKAEHNARRHSLQILVNTWSTFIESPIEGVLCVRKDSTRGTLTIELR